MASLVARLVGVRRALSAAQLSAGNADEGSARSPSRSGISQAGHRDQQSISSLQNV